MKRLSLITAALLISTSLYADGDLQLPVIEHEHGVDVNASDSSALTYGFSLEGRIRPEQTNNGFKNAQVNQFLTKIGFNYEINPKVGVFGSVWARSRNSPGWTTNDDYITAVDIFVGAYYNVHKYFNPYVFLERYVDSEYGQHTDDAGNPTYTNDRLISDFGAIGFSGTAWKSGKHSISYYAEYYFSLGKQDGDYALDFPDTFDEYGSETAVKYSYKIYDNTTLYLQPTWYVYGNKGYSKGVMEPRFGITIGF